MKPYQPTSRKPFEFLFLSLTVASIVGCKHLCNGLAQNIKSCGPLSPQQHQHHHHQQQQQHVLANGNTATIYTTYWDEILSQEYRAAVEEIKDRRSKWSDARLEAIGMSIFGASAAPDSEVYGDKIVRIYKQRKRELKGQDRRLLRDVFSRGDVLVMTPENDGGGRTFRIQTIPRECLVVDVGDDWLTVAVGSTWPAGLWETRRKNTGAYLVRLDRTAPQTPMKIQKKALERLQRGEAGIAANILAGSFINGNEKSFLDDANNNPSHFVTSTTLKDEVANALDKTRKQISFEPNQSQMDAVSFALQRRISLIQGPPGTGKTRCASLLIATALNMKTNNIDIKHDSDDIYNNSKAPRILAVTHSNGAADVLLEALLNMGVPAVRLGRPSSVSAKVQHRTVIAIAETIPEVARLRQKANNASLDSQSRSAAEFDCKQYLKDTINAIYANAPVIVASCIGANQLLKEGISFPIVVLDEAAQTTEPAFMCALAVSKAEQVILIGDTKQLPPTITAMELKDSLGLSPMSRLEKVGIDKVTLGIQYRMPQSLIDHPSKYFYDGLVSCANNDANHAKPPTGFPWPNSLPLAFIHSGEDNEIAHNFGGKSNPTEISLIKRILINLLEFGNIDAHDIAVITPYSKQVQAIRVELTSNMGVDKRMKMDQIKIGTVDSFQGRETDLVLFSAVRSNLLKEMGFLRDPRRLNVAITRARKGLILVGDRNVLNTCKHWASLLKSCEDRGCVIDSIHPLQMNEERQKRRNSEDEMFDEVFGDSDELYGLFEP